MSGTVTSEATLEKLPVSTVLRDLNGYVFEKVAERGVEMTGVVGKFGLSWVKYPAEVLWLVTFAAGRTVLRVVLGRPEAAYRSLRAAEVSRDRAAQEPKP